VIALQPDDREKVIASGLAIGLPMSQRALAA
jgi:hypothetical protein